MTTSTVSPSTTWSTVPVAAPADPLEQPATARTARTATIRHIPTELPPPPTGIRSVLRNRPDRADPYGQFGSEALEDGAGAQAAAAAHRHQAVPAADPL